MEVMLEVIQRKRRFVSIPWYPASLLGRLFAYVPLITPPITADQVKLLKRDNVVSREAIDEGRTLEGVGIEPTLIEAILPTYLTRFRVQGQFTRPDGTTADRGHT